MATYLFHRRSSPTLLQEEAPTLALHVFFQMWRTRMDPYQRLIESDTIYLGDPATRRILWEAHPTAVLSNFNYLSTRHALAALRSAYGLYADDLNDYHHDRSGHGWLIAWAPRIMRRLDVALPDGFHFGQNGYRELTPTAMTELGLPRPKRGKPLASPPDWYEPSAATTGRVTHVPRYIPLHVRRAVVDRDHGRCVGCGTEVDLHFDHIHPWSHGGDSSVANLRLLCATSNLSRGAGNLDSALACATRWPEQSQHHPVERRPIG